MAKQFQWRRGTTTQHGAFTGAEGEVTVDTDKDTLVVHDGSTLGGFPIALEANLGTMASQNSSSVLITGGSITGMPDPTLSSDVTTKNYVDNELTAISSISISDIVEDTTPQLGGNLDAQGFKIINLGEPTANSDAATKSYVDSVAAGLDPKESVQVATVADMGFTFVNNGGVGDTLTAGGAGFTSVDDVNLVDDYRVLVKNQSTATQNGIYIASATGSGGTTVLTRATDQDGTPSNEVSAGNFSFVEQGTVNAQTGWVVVGSGILTINTDNIVWVQFSAVGGAVDAATLDGLDSSDFLQVALSQAYTKQKYFAGDILVDGEGAIPWNLDDSQVASITLGSNLILLTPINMKNGGTYILTIKQDGTGNRALTYGGAYKWPNGVIPTLTSVPGSVDIITFVSDGVNMFGVAQLNFS